MTVNILNWPAWDVLKVQETTDDYRIDARPKARPPACLFCGFIGGLQQYGTRETRYMDLPIHAKRVGVYVPRRRFKCNECGHIFIEPLPEMDESHRMTKRLVDYIQQESLRRTFTDVANLTGLDEKTIRLIFQKHVAGLEEEYTFHAPAVLGIDEIHLIGKPRCVLANVEQRTIIDLLKDRNKKTVEAWLRKMADGHKVEIICMDMWRPYRDAAAAEMPQAMVVVDKFHVVRMANEALDKVRKELRERLSAKRRRQLKKDRFILLRRKHDLDDEDLFILQTWTENFPSLGAAYDLKEEFFKIWDCATRDEAAAAYDGWRAGIPAELADAFEPITTAVENWREEIFNYFDTRMTNAYTEALNSVIRQINRIGRGYSFEAVRAKILYSVGVHRKIHHNYRRDWTADHIDLRRIQEPQPAWDALTSGLTVNYGTDLSTLATILEEGRFDALSTTYSE